MLAACTLSMALSYGIVRFMARDVPHEGDPGHPDIQNADEFRRHSNALITLANEYIRHFNDQPDPKRASPAFKSWVEREFMPKLNGLRTGISQSRASGILLATLLAAADDLAVMAYSPGNEKLRTHAIQRVRNAASQIEAYISRIGVGVHLSEYRKELNF